MKTYVIGDIHGEYDRLEKVLELSGFNKEEDLLITLGDIVDRGKDWVKCVDILFTIKNRIDVRGNHDDVFVEYIRTGHNGFRGHYGSAKTIELYEELEDKFKYEHFFNKQIMYHIDDKNRVFVHGGFDRDKPIAEQDHSILLWNKELLEKSFSVRNGKLKTADNFDVVFIGHTSTIAYGNGLTLPTYTGNLIWNLDTGAGKGGLLTIMDIDTKEYWQA